ncbi:hypothetical protein V2J09_020393 [Rumex salicifolius]
MESTETPASSLTVPLVEDDQQIDKAQVGDGGFRCRHELLDESKKQLGLAGPLIAVNVMLSLSQLISSMFVGHLGKRALSGSSLASSFASLTGFSILIAAEAEKYALFLIPSLFGYSLLHCMIKFLQTQSIVFPMMITTAIATLVHILSCWVLVLKSGLGSRGAALAIGIFYWVNVLLLALYVKFSPSCAKTWNGCSKEALSDVPNFFKLAIPSAFMVCLTNWSFELTVFLAGLLPNPELETSVLSICFNTAATIWMIPFGLSHPQAARYAVLVVLFLAVTEGALVGLILVLLKNVWGYAYSNEVEVVRYVGAMLPILAFSNFADGIECVLSGVVRGCGWQKVGACINLGSYYLVGMPSAILLAFVLHIGGRGLWLGIICALIVQMASLLTITMRTNWEIEAKRAADRVHKSTLPVDENIGKKMEEEKLTTLSLLRTPLIKNEEICKEERRIAAKEEVKKQLWLALPLIIVNLLLFSLQLISIMFVGHLGELSLSAASMATSFATVTGFSLLISAEAGKYAQALIPCLFAYGLLQCLIRYLQSQNIVFPMMVATGITTCLHLGLSWALVFNTGLKARGAAVATALSYWLNVVFLVLYVKFSPSCKKTWTGLEMWSFEMIVLLSGLLPNPKLETSVLSISLNTASTVWMIPSGLSSAVSTRVSNELGAGRPQAARLAVEVVLCMSFIEGLVVGSILILIRNVWGNAYSNEAEVVTYVAKMMPILAISNFIDGLQCVLSGNARGCGWQKIGAYINLGSYYLVGIPLAVVLAFVLHVGGKGLWFGIICALTVQVACLLTITIRTNWEQEAKKAVDRVYDSTIPVDCVS